MNTNELIQKFKDNLPKTHAAAMNVANMSNRRIDVITYKDMMDLGYLYGHEHFRCTADAATTISNMFDAILHADIPEVDRRRVENDCIGIYYRPNYHHVNRFVPKTLSPVQVLCGIDLIILVFDPDTIERYRQLDDDLAMNFIYSYMHERQLNSQQLDYKTSIDGKTPEMIARTFQRMMASVVECVDLPSKIKLSRFVEAYPDTVKEITNRNPNWSKYLSFIVDTMESTPMSLMHNVCETGYDNQYDFIYDNSDFAAVVYALR